MARPFFNNDTENRGSGVNDCMRSGQPLEVVPLDVSEFGRAGRMLGGAFQTDPLWTAVIGDSVRRPEMLVRMFTALIKTTVPATPLSMCIATLDTGSPATEAIHSLV